MDFSQKKLNLGILAHVDAGKTTLTEQFLFLTGVTRALGTVDDGTAMTDFLDVERKRGISVKASNAPLEYKGTFLNIIDTPGHVDFAAEVERSMMVLDAAVLVISAVEGIQSQTEVLIEALVKTKTPTAVFINKIDRVGSRADEICRELKERFSLPLLMCSTLTDEGTKGARSHGFSLADESFLEDVLAMLPDGERLMEAYLMGTEIDLHELTAQLTDAFAKLALYPVFFGSAKEGVGVEPLLDFLSTYGSQPKNVDGEELSGIVYQITHDKTMGRIAHVRLFGGTLKNRDGIVFQGKEKEEKISQIRRYSGSRFTDIGVATKGDVAALCGLSGAKVSDIIGTLSDEYHYPISVPFLKVKVFPQTPAQMPALLNAFHELCAEDPKLDMEYLTEKKELNIHITGAIQLEILTILIEERYGLQVTFSPPTVIYKETPIKKGFGFDAYTMPKPCWAIVGLDIEPAPRGSGLIYHSVVPPKQIFYRYQNHIATSVPQALKQGLYGWEVTDLKVTLVSGEHHTLHTHPLDFFLATPIAVMKGLIDCGTTLLEPMQQMRITAKEDFLGKIIGDMTAMRGSYDTPVLHDGNFTLEATVPAATSLDYSIRLASLTSGHGHMAIRFAGFEPCPLELGKTTPRRGINPLDRDKWILHKRSAMQESFDA